MNLPRDPTRKRNIIYNDPMMIVVVASPSSRGSKLYLLMRGVYLHKTKWAQYIIISFTGCVSRWPCAVVLGEKKIRKVRALQYRLIQNTAASAATSNQRHLLVRYYLCKSRRHRIRTIYIVTTVSVRRGFRTIHPTDCNRLCIRARVAAAPYYTITRAGTPNDARVIKCNMIILDVRKTTTCYDGTTFKTIFIITCSVL